MNTEKRHWWVAGLLAVLALVATVAIPFFTGLGLGVLPRLPEIILPLLVISGVVGLLATLTIAAVAFAALNLSDSGQALSLPRGSVRALIALSLILIFAITSTFLFRELAGGGTSDAGVRFAQQILTTVSTLVVAVAGFYFGTRSVEVARRAVEPPTLRVLSPPSPAKLAKTQGEKLPTPIKVETTPIGEAITWEIDGDDDGSLLQVKPYEFEYTRGSSPADTVTLKFALVNHPDVTAELKVEKPPEELTE